jgi:hypothetical protein
MARFFNTTGPCNPDKHYFLEPSRRLVGGEINRYIKNELYWVLHAPRQSGKTTFLQSWMREINASGQAIACYVSIERCQQFPLAAEAMPAVCEAIRSYAEIFLSSEFIPPKVDVSAASMVSEIMTSWAKLVAPKPLVVLFDEVDVLQDQAMVSFLRQLRGGFAARGIGKFPVSVALVGMRDLRDYLIQSKDGHLVNPGSPFNIKEDSATIGNFPADDIKELAGQHTTETGQVFSADALDLIYDFTRGQPWLTNSILKKCTWTLCAGGEPVNSAHIYQAKEMLIQERAVHLDSLVERLKDPRVKRIVQTILIGDMNPEVMQGDDFRFTLDMGLVCIEQGTPSIANPIYREVIARVLSEPYQLSIPAPEFAWQKTDGTLDMNALLKEFQRFWRRHGDNWEAKADYTEAFPHLLLMAFFQRVVNGGGRVEREYAAGRGRMDLAILYNGVWNIIEIKLVHPGDGRELTIEDGLTQTVRYRDRIDNNAACYLVVFDHTPAGKEKTWEERLTFEVLPAEGGEVTVVGG